jgi:hypothetical protein
MGDAADRSYSSSPVQLPDGPAGPGGVLDEALEALRTGAPTGPDAVKVGLLARPAIWLAGAPHDRIASRGDKLMYGATGFLMVLVAVVAGGLMAAFVNTVTDTSWSIAGTVVGVVWGLVILAVDRSILTLRPHTKSSWATGGSYVVRTLLALAIAVIVGETALLQIFHSEIKTQATADSYAAAAKKRQDVVTGFKTRAQVQAEAGVPTACSPQQRAALQKQLSDALKLLADEQYGVKRAGTSGVPGDGTLSREAGTTVARDRDELNAFDQGCSQATNSANDAWTKQQAQVAAETSTIDVVQQQSRLSWTDQEDALEHVMAAPTTPLFAKTLPWLLRLVMILIDLLPLLAKVAMRSSETESLLRDEADWHTTRRAIWRRAAIGLTEYEAAAASTDRKERIDADRLRRQWFTWRGESADPPVLRPTVSARIIDVRDSQLNQGAAGGSGRSAHNGAGASTPPAPRSPADGEPVQ